MTVIRAQAGEQFDRLIPIRDALGLPVALTGTWVARVQVRTAPRAVPVLHEWTSTGPTPNATIVPGADGGVRLAATPAETTAWADTWPPGPLPWDLLLADPAGEPYVLDLGRITTDPHITR